MIIPYRKQVALGKYDSKNFANSSVTGTLFSIDTNFFKKIPTLGTKMTSIEIIKKIGFLNGASECFHEEPHPETAPRNPALGTGMPQHADSDSMLARTQEGQEQRFQSFRVVGFANAKTVLPIHRSV